MVQRDAIVCAVVAVVGRQDSRLCISADLRCSSPQHRHWNGLSARSLLQLTSGLSQRLVKRHH